MTTRLGVPTGTTAEETADFVGDVLPVDLLSSRAGGCRERGTGLVGQSSIPLATDSGRDEAIESRRNRLSDVVSATLNDDIDVEGRILFMTDILLSGRSVTACNRDAGRTGVDVISFNSSARRRRLSARCRSTGD